MTNEATGRTGGWAEGAKAALVRRFFVPWWAWGVGLAYLAFSVFTSGVQLVDTAHDASGVNHSASGHIAQSA